MNNLLHQWKESFFTEPIMVLVTILALIISFKKGKDFPALRLIPIYLTSFLILIANGYISQILYPNSSNNQPIHKMEATSSYIVTIIEFITFAYYLYSITHLDRYKKIIKVTTSVAFLLLLVLTIKNINEEKSYSNQLPGKLYIIESLSLLLCCVFYFIELFTLPPINKLLHSPNFWIVSGLMFYLVGSFPMSFFPNLMPATDLSLFKDLYAVIYICYLILFLMIIRGYMCNPPKLANSKIPNHI